MGVAFRPVHGTETTALARSMAVLHTWSLLAHPHVRAHVRTHARRTRDGSCESGLGRLAASSYLGRILVLIALHDRHTDVNVVACFGESGLAGSPPRAMLVAF